MGILNSKPFLLRCCEAGIWGNYHIYEGGSIGDAGFLFLSGKADISILEANTGVFRGRAIVCLSEDWENALLSTFPDICVLTRWHMKPRNTFDYMEEPVLPPGYEHRLWDREIFESHPFNHGEQYPDAESFLTCGAGAAAIFEKKIVCSASTFLSWNSEAELDVSTLEPHQRKGLARACVCQMLRNCEARGITLHWDAQNETSRQLAQRFGYELDQQYSVYVIL